MAGDVFPRSATCAVRRLLIVIAWAAALGAALIFDRPIAELIARHPLGYSSELYSMFRFAGYVPLWLLVSAAFILIDSSAGWRRAWRRGGMLFASALMAGLLAEILKILIRRERPSLDISEYAFRSWTEGTFASGGLGWPSSHTAVAFGAAWALCRLHPRAAPLWMLIGVACGVSRIGNNAHFASDVVGGALVGFLVVAMLWRGTSRGGW
jgi:membrane-associated phospholipid phosphatase